VGAVSSIASFYEGWRKANRRLIEGVATLSDDQLALRAGGYMPIWAIASHTAGTRVFWLCAILKEPGAETTPFTDPGGEGWEDHLDHPRTAAEVVGALETSWKIVERCLATWTSEMLAEEFPRVRNGVVQTHTRQSVIMRMITHDSFHAGEISMILGIAGLPEIDLWRPDPQAS
jgi:uncharacterized damage-inducible protein DinB